MKFFLNKVHSTQKTTRSYRKEAAVFSNPVANQMVADFAQLTHPDKIELFLGTRGHFDKLISESVQAGELTQLDPAKWPNSYYTRSDINDVARVEHKTIIASRHEDDAGAKLHWRHPTDIRRELNHIARGSMEGRTLYVVPFSMGPIDSPFSIIGIQLTDSRYVAQSMFVMTRTGEEVIRKINDGHSFVRCLHAKADLNPDRRWIVHFPTSQEIYSVGSNYGGNALLGKKCLALRIASVLGNQSGWMAEHMLITGITDPQGKTTYITAAFPSACGKTNLAMIQPPKHYADLGYKVSTLGDDISWMYVDEEGQLRAINPENGFFGVAPGTSEKTNPHMMNAIKHDTIFTNVALYKNENGQWEPWWEGLTDTPPAGLIDWQGKPYDPASGKPAAHPNSRFTTPATNAAVLSEHFNDPKGVPVSAFLFGGRRAKLAPLVYEATDWNHGVYVASTMASETTAAATGAVGEVRRDPMAMLPFFGYNIGEYFRHWLTMGTKMEKQPKIFHVNWFRKDENGKFMWPGYGDNFHVIKWIIDRVNGQATAEETAIGLVPGKDFAVPGLNISPERLKELFNIDPALWENELESIEEFYAEVGGRLPARLKAELNYAKARIQKLKKNQEDKKSN